MREIKFQFLFKGLPFTSDSDGFNWHKKVYSLDQLISKSLNDLCGGKSLLGELVAKRQYTGLKDKNGVEIYEGDILEHPDRGLFIVKFRRGSFVGEKNGSPASGFSMTLLLYNSMHARGDAIVIGNKYESPDLLENSK